MPASKRAAVSECVSELQSGSDDAKERALQTLVSITKVSPHNRNLVAKADGAIPSILTLLKSPSSPALQALSLTILFNLSLNPNLKRSLANIETIKQLNSIILSRHSSESIVLAASLICSLAMLDKNKAVFGVADTIQSLVTVVSGPGGPATHYLLSSLAELVQFHGNCTLAVRSGAVEILLRIVESTDDGDLSGTSLTILCLLARFNEGLEALTRSDHVVGKMLDVLRGKWMLSKEGAAEILLRLFDESEGCLRDAMRLPEFSSVLADLSVRGSGKAREKASLLMKKMMQTEVPYISKNPSFSRW